MSKTYKNAFLNISADAGLDARHGCFVNRDKIGITPLKIEAAGTDLGWYITADVRHQFDWMLDAPSFSRAWIHRERQLSRRILHFTEKEIVWECCGAERSSFASETFPGGPPFDRLFDLDQKFQVPSSRKADDEDDDNYELYPRWNELCDNLSRKCVTKPTDMPLVLSSLAEDFSNLLPSDQYVAGFWRSQLPQALLWDVKDKLAKLEEYIAPSWSWLSVSAWIQLNHRWTIDTKYELCTIDNLEAKPRYDQFGPLETGAITMTGILRSISVTFSDNERSDELAVYDDILNTQKRAIGGSWDDYHGRLFKVELDHCSDPTEIDCAVFLVTIQQSWHEPVTYREVAGLLLQPDETHGTCRRIGTLTLDDHYALKMRYKIDPQKELDLDQNYWKRDEADPKRDYFDFWEGWAVRLRIEHDERVSVM